MNVTEILQSFFGGDGAARLGEVAGLDAGSAQQALSAGLPLQLDALADHAGSADGQAQITDAIQNLPRFSSVGDALGGPDGASNLQRAGELLAPVLLGGRAGNIASTVAGQVGGASVGGVQNLLQMALPLVLSVLGQQGGNVASILGGLKGMPGGVGGGLGAAGAGVAGAAALGGLGRQAGEGAADTASRAPGDAGNAVSGVAGLDMVGAGTAGVGAASGLTGTSGTPDGDLLNLLRAQFGGPLGEKVGAAAGYSGGAAGRAAQAALPVVLGAVAAKGRTEAGADDVLRMAQPFGDLSDAHGTVNSDKLNDPADLSRIEAQGRGALGSLMGNLDEVVGRFGSALGGSGDSSRKLLALVAPLVLSVIASRGLKAGALSSVLGGLSGNLAGLLPAGLGGLGALLAGGAATSAPGGAAASSVPTSSVPSVAGMPSRPAVSGADAPAVPGVTTTMPAGPSVPVAPPPAAARGRGGFPWWIIPLLAVLLLGGCWLVNRNKAGDTASAAGSILVTNPTSGADLPAADFTMNGTGPAGAHLTIQDQGQQVADTTVGSDGTWTAPIPAPTVGEHTYTINNGDARNEFKVNVTNAAGSTGAAATDANGTAGADATTSLAPADGTFAVTEPAANATLPAGGFTMRGTGTPGQSLQILEDGTSLGNVTVADDGTWTLDVPSPTAGAHTYAVKGPDGTDLGTLSATIGAAAAGASAASCTKDYTLSITDGQTVSEPFRFGGVGQGQGYTVTVKRGGRTIGTKVVPLDSTCGWSYQSRPGAGAITYEVRPTSDPSAAALSTVNLNVSQ